MCLPTACRVRCGRQIRSWRRGVIDEPAYMIQAGRGDSVPDTFCAKHLSPLACIGVGPLTSPCMARVPNDVRQGMSPRRTTNALDRRVIVGAAGCHGNRPCRRRWLGSVVGPCAVHSRDHGDRFVPHEEARSPLRYWWGNRRRRGIRRLRPCRPIRT